MSWVWRSWGARGGGPGWTNTRRHGDSALRVGGHDNGAGEKESITTSALIGLGRSADLSRIASDSDIQLESA